MLIKEDRRLIVREISAQFGIGHHTVHKMIVTLGYWKVCSHWVLCLIKSEHKKMCMDVLSQLFDDMLLLVVTSCSTLSLVMKAFSTILSQK
jgi:hypothetical protein